MEKKKLIGIKCKSKFFVLEFVSETYGGYRSIKSLIVNGKRPVRTFHPEWCTVDNEPKIVQTIVKQPSINHRYELIDKTMESSKIPLILKIEDALEEIGCERFWKEKYKMYESLYKFCSDARPDILEDIEFDYETIMEVTEIREYGEIAYDVQKTQWKHDGLKTLTEHDVHHQLIDQIIFPDILLPSKSCSLTSKQSFDIVRQYIKQHINYEVATITSDYDFCFTVKKKIRLSEEEEYIVDINQWNNRKPKLEKRYHKFREIECFNMAPKVYQNYKVIQGFRGNNQEDLKNNIDDYCRMVIELINEPIADCPNCKGTGVILNKLEF